MDNLKVIENDIVPVYETDRGEHVVYGSDLHKALEAKTPYRIWSERRLEECDAVEGVDFQAVEIRLPGNPSPKKNHIISKELAREICLLERNPIGRALRKQLCRRPIYSSKITKSKYCKSIYVLKRNDEYKVGVSYDPEARFEQLNVGNPYCELVYASIPILNGFQIETMIHAKLDKYKIKGEWYIIKNYESLYCLIEEIISEYGITIKPYTKG